MAAARCSLSRRLTEIPLDVSRNAARVARFSGTLSGPPRTGLRGAAFQPDALQPVALPQHGLRRCHAAASQTSGGVGRVGVQGSRLARRGQPRHTPLQQGAPPSPPPPLLLRLSSCASSSCPALCSKAQRGWASWAREPPCAHGTGLRVVRARGCIGMASWRRVGQSGLEASRLATTALT